jgi:hypothetical protein
MPKQLSRTDQVLLYWLARTGGLRAEDARKYPGLEHIRTTEAMTKRLDRLCAAGYVAASPLLRGPRLYRLSQKGARLTSAPNSYTAKPTAGKLVQLVSISAVGARVKEVVFVSPQQLASLAQDLSVDPIPANFPGRFALRTFPASDAANGHDGETHVFYWLAENRSPENLVKRVETIIAKLRTYALFASLIELDLFGVAVAVPSMAAKAALEQKPFPTKTEFWVLEQLHDVIP